MISVILCTARNNFPIIGLPKLHIFEPTFKSLKEQTFKDFELILVDALYPQRKGFVEKGWGFPIKYVPPHPNHRFWLDNKRWNIAGMLNSAILHVDGDLIVRIDDCSQFTPDFLQRFWDGYRRGVWPMAMHIRFLEGKPAYLNKEYLEKGYEAKYSETFENNGRTEILKRVYGMDGLVRDSRYPIVKAKGGRMIAHPDWYYGYSSLNLEAAIKVNGWDERFDSSKSLEDSDMGNRLVMAGYKNMFQLDVNHQVVEHEHLPISEDIIAPNSKPIVCNYAVLLSNRMKNRWRANSEKLSEEDVEFIIGESLKPPCSPKPNFYLDDCRGEMFKKWLTYGQSHMFDLRAERLEI